MLTNFYRFAYSDWFSVATSIILEYKNQPVTFARWPYISNKKIILLFRNIRLTIYYKIDLIK